MSDRFSAKTAVLFPIHIFPTFYSMQQCAQIKTTSPKFTGTERQPEIPKWKVWIGLSKETALPSFSFLLIDAWDIERQLELQQPFYHEVFTKEGRAERVGTEKKVKETILEP